MLLLTISTSGCEVGHSWFSMSSDSPSPWFGFDLMPRRRTSQLAPYEMDHRVKVAKTPQHRGNERPRPSQVHSKELHLPSIPVFFESDVVEELSFTGPEGAFSR
jgi:hypothetical protein